MSSSDDHIYGLAGVGIFCITAVSVPLILSAFFKQTDATEADPAPVALIAVYWTPCEAPRPDVACWRGGGRAVVCLPLSRNEENE